MREMGIQDLQDDVADFHRNIGQPAPDTLNHESVDLSLRQRLIEEEFKELMGAMGYEEEYFYDSYEGWKRESDPDWSAVIDALCDLIYVCVGTAVAAGVPLGSFWDEVHRTNMTKVGGPVDPKTGKQGKPEGWKPPKIRQMWKSLLAKAGER